MWHSYIFRKCCKFWHHTPLSCQKRCSKIQKIWHQIHALYALRNFTHIYVKVLMYLSSSPGDHGDFEYEITGASVQWRDTAPSDFIGWAAEKIALCRNQHHLRQLYHRLRLIRMEISWVYSRRKTKSGTFSAKRLSCLSVSQFALPRQLDLWRKMDLANSGISVNFDARPTISPA